MLGVSSPRVSVSTVVSATGGVLASLCALRLGGDYCATWVISNGFGC
ncbi:Uncharacterised protein [Mycobacteroides abscessus]|nr:Uncharacterised protein [Mycobacteroides abscessus]